MARGEQRECFAAVPLVPADESAGNNPARSILAVVTPMLEGELLLSEGRHEAGLAQLRAAVKAEDALRYDEPPGWLIPVRHSLGASLLQAGRFTEAERVYREDLARLPENGWALWGLAQSLRLQGKEAEAVAADGRFQKVWSKADVQIKSSCLCRPELARR